MVLSPRKIVIEAEDIETSSEVATIKLLAFLLGEENYCVGIEEVKEIIHLTHVTRVPHTPSFIRGVINLRGKIVSLLDIRHFFSLTESEDTKEKRILITDTTGPFIGILVDKVKGSFDISHSSVQPPLPTLNSSVIEYTKGQIQNNDEIYTYLDLRKILSSEKINNL
jgi:purine-binding chemotaxis protein CheW